MAIPTLLEELVAEQYDSAAAGSIIEGCSAERSTALRANTLKATAESIAEALEAADIAFERLPWFEDAFVLEPGMEPAVRELGEYERGELYLQNPSAFVPVVALGAKPGEDVLDMCAAPGGKTSLIAALSGGKSHITACEMSAPRASKLEYNLQKLGVRNAVVMRTDARRLDDYFSFDRILLDAPCSGSGTILAGDDRQASRFTEKLIAKTVKSQRALLAKALSVLKPGGTLVYATCSILARENEEVVRDALDAKSVRGSYEIDPIDPADFPGLALLPTSLEGAICLCPTNIYEGFFVAKIKRIR